MAPSSSASYGVARAASPAKSALCANASPGISGLFNARSSRSDDHADGSSAVPGFVAPQYAEPLARAAQRWNVSATPLAAQLYAESGFNPFASSGAGAQGIAPVHAGYREGLRALQPVRPGGGDRCPGAFDARPAAAVRLKRRGDNGCVLNAAPRHR